MLGRQSACHGANTCENRTQYKRWSNTCPLRVVCFFVLRFVWIFVLGLYLRLCLCLFLGCAKGACHSGGAGQWHGYLGCSMCLGHARFYFEALCATSGKGANRNCLSTVGACKSFPVFAGLQGIRHLGVAGCAMCGTLWHPPNPPSMCEYVQVCDVCLCNRPLQYGLSPNAIIIYTLLSLMIPT